MGSPSFSRTRRTQRSFSSNQPAVAVEEEDERFSFGVSANGEEILGGSVVLLNLRRSMAEHLRQKLQEKLYRQYGDFLTICSISQSPSGKLEGLECEVKDEEHHRIVITCEPQNQFIVFTSSSASDEFASWLETVMSFGISGRCASLSALFQFMYQRRKSATSSGLSPVVLEPSLGSAIERAREAASTNRPHQAIDIISESFRSNGVAIRPPASVTAARSSVLIDLPPAIASQEVADALFVRCGCYAKAGMFTLALADADFYTQIVHVADCGSNLAEILFWRAFSLEGLLRPREALESYMAALDADPCHSRAQEQFHILFEGISRSVEHAASSNDATMSPTSSTRRSAHPQGSSVLRPRDRGRSEATVNESIATDSRTSGTTASRRSSRSTTPTDSSGSERDE